MIVDISLGVSSHKTSDFHIRFLGRLVAQGEINMSLWCSHLVTVQSEDLEKNFKQTIIIQGK